tara:strand:+ start:2315 stop:3493 length:1179 start_codon:yes stop_codon:yes gene_type:complete
MKITLIANSNIEDGGGHSQSLTAISQFKKITNEIYDLEILSMTPENKNLKSLMGIKHSTYNVSFLDKLFLRLLDNNLFIEILNKFNIKSPFENRLKKIDTDLAYFLSPNNFCTILSDINYIVTVWDLCHRDFPEFPEVRESFEFRIREKFYSKISNASLIISDSDESSENLSIRYGHDKNKIISIPFSFPKRLKSNLTPLEKILAKSFIDSGFFFYPAQYWPHKNHFLILEALRCLNEEDIKVNFVFCGSDKGNLKKLKEISKEFDISDQIKFLGFVNEQDLNALYQSCIAVVMPTFFGPTNIPPIEAWSYEKPLIYSNHLSINKLGSIMSIDPFSSKSIANAIKDILNKNYDHELLIKNGLDELSILDKKRNQSEKLLLDFLEKFEHKIRC